MPLDRRRMIVFGEWKMLLQTFLEADENAPKYGEVIDSAILNGTELLLDFVLPLLFLRSEIDVALELACRFFADYECRRTPIEWSMEVDNCKF